MRPSACALLLALLLAACPGGDRNDPSAWTKRLEDADPRVRVDAVRQLRRLKAKQAAPEISLLLKDLLVKEDAALALQDLGGPEEVPALVEAVDTTVGAGSDEAARIAIRTNAKIAVALGNIAAQTISPIDGRTGPTLLRLARSGDEVVRLAAVQALGEVRERSAIPELSRMVDDEATQPLLVKKAVVSLGQMRDAAAIPALEHALVIERQGVSFYPEASLALFFLGPSGTDALLKLLQDQDQQYLAWAKEHDRSPAGAYAKAALVLGDLGDPRAVPVLVQKLSYRDGDPNGPTARILTNLVRQSAANALGRLRAKEAAAPIQAILSTRDPIDEELTAFAAEALVWIGDRSQARELMKKARMGAPRLRIIAAQAAALLGEATLAKDLLAIAALEEKGRLAECERELRDLAMQSDPKQACALFASTFSELAHPLEAARVCAQDAPCWLSRLQDKDDLVRARAAYELGRAGAAQAVPQLVESLKADKPLVRVAAVRSLEWLVGVPAAKEALKGAAPQLSSQLAAQAGKRQPARVDEELKRLQIKLSRL